MGILSLYVPGLKVIRTKSSKETSRIKILGIEVVDSKKPSDSGTCQRHHHLHLCQPLAPPAVTFRGEWQASLCLRPDVAIRWCMGDLTDL